ncbi:MAG: ATP-binding protein, partial [Limibaculum sp.]
SGKAIAIGAIGTDITERKRAEEALRQSEQRLQRSVLDAPIPIMIHAEDGEVLMINQEWTSLTGYTHAEIPTIPVWTELAYGSQGITDRARERIGSLYDIEEKEIEGDYHITTKSGESRIWDFRSSPLGKLPDGRRFVISMAMDVTERRMAHDELERRVEERTAELRAAQVDLLRQERLVTLGQLTATVSHELRNPLSVIRTSIFIARDGLNGTTPRVQRALERIDRSVTRCDRIIDELLDFTRISGLEPEPTPIDDWLDGTLKEQALPAQITLRRDFGLAGTTVPFDRDRFRRAIINVFDNACQAMTGAVGPEAADADNAVLSVTTKRKNGRVEVIFEDRGPGIPADVLPRIFEPLFSTKGFGVGLGLPVVKQIMEQHGGGIEIDGAATSGTRVCLWLPAEQPIP